MDRVGRVCFDLELYPINMKDAKSADFMSSVCFVLSVIDGKYMLQQCTIFRKDVVLSILIISDF
jgi:hypothetical protein